MKNILEDLYFGEIQPYSRHYNRNTCKKRVYRL